MRLNVYARVALFLTAALLVFLFVSAVASHFLNVRAGENTANPEPQVLRVFAPVVIPWLAALALIVIGALLITRRAIRPLQSLAAAATRAAEGNYVAPVPQASDDEIGRLGRAFNRMMAAVAEREAEILRQAKCDRLTNLPNRESLEERIADDIAAATVAARPLSVLLLGIDRLSDITNTLGHGTGDRLLRRIARRLTGAVATDDYVARLNDTTFVVLLRGRDEAAADAVAAGLLATFDAPFVIGDITIDAMVHIGIAQFPEHGNLPRLLLRRADIALHVGRQSVARRAVYNQERDGHRPERMSLMGELKEGLARGEFSLVYQPKLTLATATVVSAEALVRWNHPRLKTVSPALYIPMAEQTGDILRLTEWVLGEAARQLAAWQKSGLQVRAAINLSTRDLATRNLAQTFAKTLADHGLEPERLQVEITESFAMHDTVQALETLRGLRALGIHITVDDFGTGYSSMAYLSQLPIDELKIDQSLVKGALHDPVAQGILRAIIELGHGLGLKVTAEGIEDQETLRLLTDIGCDYGQGYAIAKPLPAVEFTKLLQPVG